MPELLGPACFIALGGALGATARHLCVVLGLGRLPAWLSILLVNVVGCGLLGLAVSALDPKWHPMVLTGVLGGFTTFSTAMLDVWVLWKLKRRALAAASLFGTPILGIAAAIFGLSVGGWL